jgi:starch phosphorylase
MEQKWASLRFGDVKVETQGKQHNFKVQVFLNDLNPAVVQVELYSDGVQGGAPSRQEMQRLNPVSDGSASAIYSASVSSARPTSDYTARVIAHRNGVAVPLEEAQILWQR